MATRLVLAKSASDIIYTLSHKLKGQKITIPDIFAKQNVELIESPELQGGTLTEKKKKWDFDCRDCLLSSGYIGSGMPKAYTHYRDDNNVIAPKNLEACRKALAGNLSLIEFTAEDGTKVSIALSEGCRGGMGRIEMFRPPIGHDYPILVPTDAEDARPFIFPDLGVAPTDPMIGTINEFDGFHGIRTSREFFERVESPETRLKAIELEHGGFEEEHPLSCQSVIVFKFEPPEKGRLLHLQLYLSLGSQLEKGIKPFFWVDVTKGDETVRYQLDGLRPLLFPNIFPGEF